MTKRILSVLFAMIIFALLTSCEHEHSFDKWVVEKEPTCTEDGIQYRTCKCNELETEIIPAKGHTEGEWITDINPSCNNAGSMHQVCADCNTTINTKAIASGGHSYVVDNAVAPTCTSTGLTEGKHCSLCNEVFVKQEIVQKAEHNIVIDEAVNPTCSATGLSEGTHCSACNLVITEQTVIGKIPHTPVTDAALEPTCSSPGLTEGSHCSVCRELLVAQEIVPTIAHTSSEAITENYTAPDCINNGSYDSVVYCAVCNHKLSSKTVNVDSLGHTQSASVRENYIAPDCTNNGSYDSVIYCSVCDDELSRNTVSVDALGHTEVIDATVAPTCTATGLSEGSHCSVCNKTIVEQTVLDVVKHSYVNYVCSVCDAVLTPTSIGYFEFELLENDTYSVKAKNKDNLPSVIVIPQVYNDKAVTEIAEGAFSNCPEITSITIPDSVTKIHRYAFYNCTNLADITLHDGITYIGDTAFPGTAYYKDGSNWVDDVLYIGSCLIKAKTTLSGEYVIKDGAVTIASNAFNDCDQLTGIIIPDSVTSINMRAFSGCIGLVQINITESVTLIDDSAFYRCSKNLVSITVDSDNPIYYSIDNCLIETATEKLILGCNNSIIPIGITSIGNYAFYDCDKITNITIPEGVTSIGDYAFNNCDEITDITIPGSVSSIGYAAFEKCSSLASLTISDGVKSIGYHAFEDCSALTSITIPNSVTEIGGSAFDGCDNIKNATISGSVISHIPKICLETVVITSANVIVSSGLSISSKAFMDCTTLVSVTLPDNITSISEYAFYNCENLTDITIPDGVTAIDAYTFYGCSGLTDINIPDSVTSIGDYAFLYCNNIKNVTASAYAISFIPKFSLETAVITSGDVINNDAFKDCSGLTSITLPESIKSIGDSAFYNCSELVSITIPEGLIYIGRCAFYGCRSLSGITIPEGVNYIYDHTFYDCDSITDITIPTGITSIGDYAFYDCDGLSRITIPKNVSEICIYAFYGCDGLESVTFESDSRLTDILYCTFGNCTSLVDITIPDKVVSINGDAFRSCDSLTNITIPKSVTYIDCSSFIDCDGLEVIEVDENNTAYYSQDNCLIEAANNILVLGCKNSIIPDCVTAIGAYAFAGCQDLTSITIPDSVTSIGEHVFDSCINLAEISIPDSVNSIAGNAFDNTAYYNDENNWADGVLYIGNHLIEAKTTVSGEYVIRNGTLTIADSAFSGCTQLTSVTIPSSINSIGTYAFAGCPSIKDIYITDVEAWLNVKCSNDYSMPSAYETLHILDENGNEVTDLVIPEDIAYIRHNVFKNATYITSVIISDSVRGIWEYAFSGCTSLSNVTISDSVRTVWSNAFDSCPITSAIIPASAISAIPKVSLETLVITSGDSIDAEAFKNCIGLVSVTIPDSITTIGKNAFYGCPIASATIPASAISSIPKEFLEVLVITSGDSIAAEAFKNCTRLVSVTIPDSVTFVGADAFYGCPIVNATIPGSVISAISKESLETLVITSGTSFDASEFANCTRLVSITIPDSVTSIGGDAFYRCLSLENVYISDIASWCNISFSNYASNPLYCADYLYLNGELITELVIPEGITNIPEYAFDCKNITKVYIPDSVTNIGICAFYSCSSLTSITIPDSVTDIGNCAFEGCSRLESVIIGSCVTCIGYGMFRDCSSLTSITIPDSVTDIGDCAFEGCSRLTSIMIESSVTSIGDEAFYGCQIERASIPASAISAIPKEFLKTLVITSGEAIDDDSFRGCTSIVSVTIPDTLTSIGSYAFYGCEGLESVYISDITSWCNISFGNSYSNPLYYADYLYLEEELINELVIPGGVTTIPDYAFSCKNITKAIISDNVTNIGNYAFKYCSSLTSITIPESVKSIGDGSFYYCSVLKNITIPNGVTDIGSYAFKGCSNLESAIIGNGVTEIGEDAFYGCSSLTNVSIPDSVTEIGENAFYGCSSLTSITIPDGVTSIGYGAFYGCSSLTSVSISDLAAWCSISFEHATSNPLYYAYNLYLNGNLVTELVITSDITAINNYALYNLSSNIESITVDSNNPNYYILDNCLIEKATNKLILGFKNSTIPSVVTSIGNSAFSGCTSLTDIIIPNSVTSIDDYAFHGCSGLISITVPESVTVIGAGAFSGCYSIKNIYINDIAAWCAIDRTDSASHPLLHPGYIYLNGELITELVIPDDISNIGYWSFYLCSSITSVIIPDSVTNIRYSAFIGCSDLTDVYYTGSEEEWAKISIESNNSNLLNATIHYNYVP